jgi:hypothetical protein
LDELIGDVELYLDRTVKVDDADTFYRLRSIPGVGKILALVLFYEIHDIKRFGGEGEFLSYARLIRPKKTSAGIEPLLQEACPFKRRPKANAQARWVRPELVCEIAFSSWTQDGMMRHPVFHGLKGDVSAPTVHRE